MEEVERVQDLLGEQCPVVLNVDANFIRAKVIRVGLAVLWINGVVPGAEFFDRASFVVIANGNEFPLCVFVTNLLKEEHGHGEGNGIRLDVDDLLDRDYLQQVQIVFHCLSIIVVEWKAIAVIGRE